MRRWATLAVSMETPSLPNAMEPLLQKHRIDELRKHSPSPLLDSPKSSEDGLASDTSLSSGTTTGAQPYPSRQNHVTSVLLHGVPIVSLSIDGKERLCLAQISNTLLKDYSYNEIHNRRVALGITCVQCTPVQLEILRRAGAMPVSSRRCGMITKREAERLVKSFLEDAEPPKLPEGYAFQVFHECGWGCHGFFEPARYNSSRAKCIKCALCNVFFSPNKFIFHFHRTADAKYHHPDAANFNSWRRHLKLVGGGSDKDSHLWEDVKAMFNGGTRKRIFSSASRTRSSLVLDRKFSRSGASGQRSESTSASDAHKKPTKTTSTGELQVAPKHPFPTHFTPYGWYGASAKPAYPFVSVNTSQSLCLGFPPAVTTKDNINTENNILKNTLAPLSTPWLGRSALPFGNFDMLWDKAFTLPRHLGGGLRGNVYPSPLPKPQTGDSLGDRLMGDCSTGRSEDGCADRKRQRKDTSSFDMTRHHQQYQHHHDGTVHIDRFSAFRPVGRTRHAPEDETGSDINMGGDPDETEEIDVTEEDCCTPEDLSQRETHDGRNSCCSDGRRSENSSDGGQGDEERSNGWTESCDAFEEGEPAGKKSCPTLVEAAPQPDANIASTCAQSPNPATKDKEEMASPKDNERQVTGADDSGLSDESEGDDENEESNIQEMTKEDLYQSLRREVCNRKKREKEVLILRESFQEEVTREKSFRDQMARQLEVLRETLTNELEQERKIRFSLQQKLKEAHDALHSFSCSMLTAARDGCGFKDPVVPR